MKPFTALLILVGFLGLPVIIHAQDEPAVTLRVQTDGAKGTYSTVQGAVDKALEFASSGQSVRVLIAPGTYRESVSLIGDREKTYAAISLEGSSPDEVIITGAEILNGWKLNGDSFEVQWPQDKSLVPHIFVQGARVQFIPDARSLGVGEATLKRGTLQMLPPRNAVVRDGNVEIATRAQLLIAKDLPELRIQGIAFVNGALQREEAPPAVEFMQVKALTLDHVRIEANGYGLFVQAARQLTLAGVDCLRNRLGGARIYWSSDIRILGGSFNLNGHASDGHDKNAAGLSTRKSKGLRIERTEISENAIGMEIRFSSKETYLYGLHVYMNRTLAAELTGIDALDMVGCQIAAEDDARLVELNGCEGVIRNTIIVDEGGSTPLFQATGTGALKITDNIFAGFDHQGPIMAIGGVVVLEKAGGNLYYSGGTESGFLYKDEPFTLDGWREATGQDAKSLWGDPLFTARQRFDFSLRPASPWFKRSR